MTGPTARDELTPAERREIAECLEAHSQIRLLNRFLASEHAAARSEAPGELDADLLRVAILGHVVGPNGGCSCGDFWSDGDHARYARHLAERLAARLREARS